MSECEEFKTILNVAETVGESIVAAKQLSVDISQVNEEFNREGVVDVLKSSFKLKESSL